MTPITPTAPAIFKALLASMRPELAERFRKVREGVYQTYESLHRARAKAMYVVEKQKVYYDHLERDPVTGEETIVSEVYYLETIAEEGGRTRVRVSTTPPPQSGPHQPSLF